MPETHNPAIIDLSNVSDDELEEEFWSAEDTDESEDSDEESMPVPFLLPPTLFTRIMATIYLIRPSPSLGSTTTTTTSSEIENQENEELQEQLRGTLSRLFILPFLFSMGSLEEEGDFQTVLDRLLAMHEPRGPPPASKEAVAKLPTVTIDQKTKEEAQRCSVCFDDFQVGATALELPCKHIFDEACLTKWLSEHNTCPVCRHELPVEDPEYEQQRRERMAARGFVDDPIDLESNSTETQQPQSENQTGSSNNNSIAEPPRRRSLRTRNRTSNQISSEPIQIEDLTKSEDEKEEKPQKKRKRNSKSSKEKDEAPKKKRQPSRTTTSR